MASAIFAGVVGRPERVPVYRHRFFLVYFLYLFFLVRPSPNFLGRGPGHLTGAPAFFLTFAARVALLVLILFLTLLWFFFLVYFFSFFTFSGFVFLFFLVVLFIFLEEFL